MKGTELCSNLSMYNASSNMVEHLLVIMYTQGIAGINVKKKSSTFGFMQLYIFSHRLNTHIQ